MQNGRLPRPEIQTFELGQWKPTVRMKTPPRSVDRSVRRASSQRTLEDFENVRPVVRKLSTLQPRATGKRKRSPLRASESQANQRDGNASNPVIIGSSRSYSSGHSSRSQQTVEPQRRRTSGAGITEDMSLEAKRRRLLEMNDWTGVSTQRAVTKPVKMKFADPTDKDLVGRRRKITNMDLIRPSNRLPASGRRPMVGPNHGAIPNAYDQYYTVDDVSVRIGSAVDRSLREGTAKSSRGRREQDSVFSDELLDNGAPASVYRASPLPIPATTASQSAPLPLSDYGRRDVLTPSAFMDSSSAESDHVKNYADGSLSPSQPVEIPASVQHQQTDPESEVLFPIEQPPRGLRLVFEDSPDCRQSSQELGSDCSRIRDSATNQDVVAPAEVPKHYSPAAEYQANRRGSKHRNPKPSDRFITSSPRVAVRSHALKLQDKNISNHNQPDGGIGRAEERLNVHQVNDGLQDDTGFRNQYDVPEIVYHTEKRPLSARDEDSVWRQFTTLHQEDNAPSNSQWNEKLPSNEIPLASSPLHIKPTEDRSPKASEDEEAAWRKIVFGDDSIDSDSQQSHGHDLNSQKYPCTQPSLVAEVATSPLKQNRHLADNTFDVSSSSSYLHEASSALTPHHFETDRNASEVSYTTSPQREPSQNANGSDSAVTADSPSPSKSWHQQLLHSSMMGEASNSSPLPSPHANLSISSDELHRSPSRVPFLPQPTAPARNENKNSTHPPKSNHANRNPMVKIPPHIPNPPPTQPTHQPRPQPPKPRPAEKIIYKPPPRYSSPITAVPARPTVLGGRVLRSGRTIGRSQSQPEDDADASRREWKGKGQEKE